MISDDYKCIFIHVPKCAGESVETLLLGGPFNTSTYCGHTEKHWGVKEIKKKYPAKYAAYFSFSIVRNPWERVVSWVKYRDMRRERTSGKFEDRLWSDLNDDTFVDYMIKHSCSKMLYLDGEVGVDRIIRMENLERDFSGICDLLGLQGLLLPHVNKTEHEAFAIYYNDRSRERVAEVFSDDICLFNYKFECL